jgi:hypothetical protein
VAEPSLIDVANIMCQTVQESGWRLNSKRRYFSERVMLGVRLVVIQYKSHIVLESPFRWRVTLEYNFGGHTNDNIKVCLPFYGHPDEGGHEIFPCTFKRDYKPKVEVMVQKSYERDWVLLRMFSAQFAHHNEHLLET